jgi:uncharacterized protein with FMN-binding domain
MNKPPAHSLGRRLLPALAMTAAASGLIALLDRPSNGVASDAGASDGGDLGGDAAGTPDSAAPNVQSDPPVVSSTVPVLTPSVGGDDDNTGDDGLGDDGGDDDGQPAAPPAAAPTTTNPAVAPTAAPAANGPCDGKTVDGPSVNTRWGPVQVEAVVSTSGQICDVTAIRSPDGRRRSVSINQEALPILHDQVIKAQSTKIRGVSGATVTTDAYITSLQAILDGSAG